MLKGIIKKEGRFVSSISANVALKPISLLISLLYTPVLLSFLGDEQYGVWTTLLSVINWFTVFDFGIGGGLRNLLSKRIIDSDAGEIHETASTAYVLVSISACTLYFTGIIAVIFLDWKKLFNTNLNISPAVFFILTFVCVNLIFGLTNSILYALQKPEYVSVIGILIQLCNLSGVYLLSVVNRLYEQRIILVSRVYLFSSCFVNIVFLLLLWKRYFVFFPLPIQYNKKLSRPILNFGVKLFVMQVCSIILYTTDNMVITKLYSPATVTPYSITWTVFNIMNTVFGAVLVPFWSRYTQEMKRRNYIWIKKAISVQKAVFVFFALGVLILCVIYRPLISIWLKKDLQADNILIYIMALSVSSEMYAAIFSNFLNGVNYVNFQLKICVLEAVINIPLSVFFARICGLGVAGICLGTFVCHLISCLTLPAVVRKYIKNME